MLFYGSKTSFLAPSNVDWEEHKRILGFGTFLLLGIPDCIFGVKGTQMIHFASSSYTMTKPNLRLPDSVISCTLGYLGTADEDNAPPHTTSLPATYALAEL